MSDHLSDRWPPETRAMLDRLILAEARRRQEQEWAMMEIVLGVQICEPPPLQATYESLRRSRLPLDMLPEPEES